MTVCTNSKPDGYVTARWWNSHALLRSQCCSHAAILLPGKRYLSSRQLRPHMAIMDISAAIRPLTDLHHSVFIGYKTLNIQNTPRFWN